MGETTGIIKFYSVSDEFGEFSNFAAYPTNSDWGHRELPLELLATAITGILPQ
jgi:predicted NAD-dependent protein-ADP-ribosyltransferase YbiA (DUF1768 family)